jgi:hypothetical protein
VIRIDMELNQDCAVCYKIICKGCGWEASDRDVSAIQMGKITACPECGWKPELTN